MELIFLAILCILITTIIIYVVVYKRLSEKIYAIKKCYYKGKEELIFLQEEFRTDFEVHLKKNKLPENWNVEIIDDRIQNIYLYTGRQIMSIAYSTKSLNSLYESYKLSLYKKN